MHTFICICSIKIICCTLYKLLTNVPGTFKTQKSSVFFSTLETTNVISCKCDSYWDWWKFGLPFWLFTNNSCYISMQKLQFLFGAQYIGWTSCVWILTALAYVFIRVVLVFGADSKDVVAVSSALRRGQPKTSFLPLCASSPSGVSTVLGTSDSSCGHSYFPRPAQRQQRNVALKFILIQTMGAGNKAVENQNQLGFVLVID